MTREARILSSGSQSGRPLECEGAVAADSFMQNEPNLLRFQARNGDSTEERSQTEPILGLAGSGLMRRGNFLIISGLCEYRGMLGCFRSMEAL